MSLSFNTVVLSNDLVPQTLPLVQATWRAVDLTGWRNVVQFFTDEATSQESGVDGLRDSAACFCGIFAYRIDSDLLYTCCPPIHSGRCHQLTALYTSLTRRRG